MGANRKFHGIVGMAAIESWSPRPPSEDSEHAPVCRFGRKLNKCVHGLEARCVDDWASVPEGPGTSLLWNQGLKAIYHKDVGP